MITYYLFNCNLFLLFFTIDRDITLNDAIHFEWYRSSNSDSDNDKLIGTDENYKLVNADANSFIRLIGYFNE